MKLLACVFAALIALGPVAPAFAQERIAAPAGGISIEKPQGWTVVPPADVIENLRGHRYDSPEFGSSIQNNAAPFITLIKYPQDREGINPTIKVNLRQLPSTMQNMGLIDVLTGVIDGMQQAFGTVEVLDAPAEMQFAGQPGAHVRFGYTLVTGDGTPLQTVSEMWIVMRGNWVVILGAGYARDEPAETVQEIGAAARSFRIDG